MSIAAGTEFGDFRIERLLGSGGMGLVYEAIQISLERRVALKVLRPEFGLQPEHRERFLREARTLAKLDSPHVIQIYAFGEHERQLFLATQLVSGGDLGKLLTTFGAMSPTRAVPLMAQVCDAAHQAHRAGVLHRDIKPANVLIRAGTELHPYLCDFGIAQLSDAHGTLTAGTIGTLAYMAPERFDSEPASAATDVYSLGCLLYACLSGHPPYTGSTTHVISQHLTSKVPELDASVRHADALNHIIGVAMAKDKRYRYRSAADMRDDLRQVPLGEEYFLGSRPTRADAEVAETIHRKVPPAGPTGYARPQTRGAAGVPAGGFAGNPMSDVATADVPGVTSARRARPKSVMAVVAATLAVIASAGLLWWVVDGLRDDAASTGNKESSAGDTSKAGESRPSRSAPGPSKKRKDVDPLSIGAPLVNQGCSDEYVVLIQISGNKDTRGNLRISSESYPRSKYLKNADSCRSFRARDTRTGDPIYSVYLGPFPTLTDACSALSGVDTNWARIKHLAEDAGERELCFCRQRRDQLPTIGGDGFAPATQSTVRAIQELQWTLQLRGFVDRNSVHGNYTREFVKAVRLMQGELDLSPTGIVDSDTWQAIQREFCTEVGG